MPSSTPKVKPYGNPPNDLRDRRGPVPLSAGATVAPVVLPSDLPALTPHLTLHGQARSALEFSRDVFGGDIELALLGTADAETSTAWFRALAVDGEMIGELQRRPWGDGDGRVRRRYGVTWLIGYAPQA